MIRRRYWPRRRHHWLLIGMLLLFALVAVGLVSHHAEALAFCAFHGVRLVHDLRRHHPLWSTYQLWRAVHSCR